MHKILLVDDEPIILSGIKYLLDWESKDCQIVGTARNGQQALEEIDRLGPNIVICDIRMPVLSGLETLKQANKAHPEVTFIMLTNYQDFDLAREALRYHAVDYLLKTQLEADALEKSLDLAIQESERRRKISKVSFVENYINTNKSSLISKNIMKIITSAEDGDYSENYRILRENEIFSSYAMLEFLLDYSLLPNLSTFTLADKKRVFEFEKDMIEKLVCNFFPNYSLIMPINHERKLIIFVWNLPQNGFSDSVAKLYEKLDNASDNVTHVKLSLLVTEPFNGEEQLHPCYNQLQKMTDFYYWNECAFFMGHELPDVEYSVLNLSSHMNRLAAELNSKNIPQTNAVFEKIQQGFAETTHRRENGITFCIKFFNIVSSVMTSLLPEDSANYYIDNKAEIIQNIQGFLTKSEALNWIDQIKNSLIMQLEELNTSKSHIIDKACDYILLNIEKRILLQDVASHINISPSYLSSLFKKHFNQNFVDYVNMKKTERACELIREGQYRIYEISYMLGFENAYYFTKVFKRYTGLTPTEYQYKCKNPSDSSQSL